MAVPTRPVGLRLSNREPRSIVKIAAVAGCLFVATFSSSAVAASIAYASPTAMASRIQGPTPQIPTSTDQVPSVITSTTCRGIGAAHKGLFNSFRCVAIWNNGQTKSVVWARARPGGQFCAASTSLAACPPAPPRVGDPRVCKTGASPYADPNHCAVGAAAFVVSRAMPVNLANPGWTVRDQTCKGQNLTWSCEFSTAGQFGTFYKGSIKFIQSKQGAWTAAFTVTGGGGPRVACTVRPGTASGTVSRWFQGPTPTCSN